MTSRVGTWSRPIARYRVNDVIAHAIVDECLDPQGFLVLLHSHNQFDSARWERLKDHLATYSTALQSSSYIHRRVAGCLVAIENEFLNHLTNNAGSTDVSPIARQVEKAYSELDLLLHSIFWE
jgi:hypothetical protein